MILPTRFLAEVLIELAEEYAHSKDVYVVLAMSAFGKYRNREDLDGIQRCSRLLDKADINLAIERMAERNLEKMLEEPLEITGDIKARLSDPVEREKLKDEVKAYYRNNFVFNYLKE